MKAKLLSAVAGSCLLSALAFVLWPSTPVELRTEKKTLRKRSPSKPRLRQRIQKVALSAPAPKLDAVAIEPAPKPVAEEAPEPTPKERLSRLMGDLQKRIEENGGPLHSPIVGPNAEYSEFRRDLLEAVEANPALVEDLLDAFSEDPNSLLGRELSAVLAETGLPEVQSAALDIALNSDEYDEGDRGSALFVLSEMDSIGGETRDRLLDSYAEEESSELLQFSLMALKPAPSTAEDYAHVHETLLETMDTDDEHVRRHAAYQMAEWATSNDDLAPVRAMALEDPDVNARARAIVSLGSSSIKSDENRAVLDAVAYDAREPIVVRLAALEALLAYPLSSAELSAYQTLIAQLKAEGEGEALYAAQ